MAWAMLETATHRVQTDILYICLFVCVCVLVNCDISTRTIANRNNLRTEDEVCVY